MSEEHERAKAVAWGEIEAHGGQLSLDRRQELRDLIWDTADEGERAVLRVQYVLAG